MSDAVIAEWHDVYSTLVVAPTGTGKTVLFADIIRRMRPQRALVIAHREELIFQARDKIMRATGLECEIEMADLQVSRGLFPSTPVLISTVQTQNSNYGDHKRMGRFSPFEFGVLIIDEAHHATAESYKNVIRYYRQNQDLRILGVTATPDRADEQALGQIFESVAYDYEILDAIHDGWLVPVEQQFVSVSGLDFSDIRTTAGDLNGADLAAVMEAESNLHGVASASLEIIGTRRSIIFSSSVKQAETLCELFNRNRPGMSEWVCGKTPKDQRREILSRFESGAVQVVCNCGVLTEGFDNPHVEVIVMARPTKSRSLYAQMAGRSTRPLPGIVDGPPTAEERRAAIASSAKPTCLIVDFVGNSGRHKLISAADILGGKVSDEAIEATVFKARESGKPVMVSAALDEEEKLHREKVEKARREAERRRMMVTPKVQYTKRMVDPFNALDIEAVPHRGWDDGKVLSEKQRNLLRKQGINPDIVTYSQGRQMIVEILRRWKEKLCSVRQAEVLKRYGFDCKNMKYAMAKIHLDDIAKHNWDRNYGQEKAKEEIQFRIRNFGTNPIS